MSFADDIKNKDTNLYPTVIIGTGNNAIYLSTNSTTINGNYYSPILLNVPGLKESIDIEKRNYKISNVTLSISNYEHNGVRFSEIVTNRSLINEPVDIYWQSPTGEKKIYKGWILRYDIGSDKITLVVEDRTQAKLDKKIPENLGVGEEIPDKYKNKTIPMVYGVVEKSPCVMGGANEDGDTQIYADTPSSGTTINGEYQASVLSNNPLMVFKNDIYLEVIANDNDLEAKITHWGYGENGGELDAGFAEQYYITGNIIQLSNKLANETTGETIITPLQENLFATKLVDTFSSYRLWDTNYNTYEAQASWFHYFDFPATEVGQFMETKVDYFANGDKHDFYRIVYTFPLLPRVTSHTPAMANNDVFVDYQVNWSLYQEDRTTVIVEIFPARANDRWENLGGDSTIEAAYLHEVNHTGGNSASPNSWYPDGIPSTPSSDSLAEPYSGQNIVNKESTSPVRGWYSGGDYEELDQFDTQGHTDKFNPILTQSFQCRGYFQYPNLFGAFGTFSFDVNDIKRTTYFLSDRFFESDFFADVTGRLEEPTAPEIIKHLLENELGVSGIALPSGYSDWIYAFTQYESIHAKELIEGIASASPFLPRFNNLGQFKFDVIKEYYQQGDIDSARPIKEADVISFSYSRTKIEDVKTKIEFHYKYDYGLDSFLGKYVVDVIGVVPPLEDIDPALDPYSYSYYGFKDEDGYDTDQDSTIIIDDDRSKYIRDDSVAEKFAKWYLRWHCNQHLKIKVKLPLSHLDIEVGSTISFDKVLGDVLPYGINYGVSMPGFSIVGEVKLGVLLNGQQAFPLFLCTSTNKTLEHVEIECIQLHNTGEEMLGRNDSLGCTAPGYWSTNLADNVINVPSRCVNESDFIQIDQCGFYDNPLNDDSANNYAGTEDLFIESTEYPGTYTSEYLPNVFIAGVPDTYPEHDNAYDAAKAYWNANGYPTPNDPNAPKIYDYSMCSWHWATYYHILESISVHIKDLNDDYVSFGYIENNFINIQLNPDHVIKYMEDNGLWFKFIYKFSTAVEPTFSGESFFNYDCFNYHPQTGEPTSIIEGGGVQIANPYGTTGEYESEVFFKKGDLDSPLFHLIDDENTEEIEVYDFTLKYNLSPSYDEALTEIVDQANLRFTGAEVPTTGDLNGDGLWNILDIVTLANCVLRDECDIGTTDEFQFQADINMDGVYNVVDIVVLINCVLTDSCAEDLSA